MSYSPCFVASLGAYANGGCYIRIMRCRTHEYAFLSKIVIPLKCTSREKYVMQLVTQGIDLDNAMKKTECFNVALST